MMKFVVTFNVYSKKSLSAFKTSLVSLVSPHSISINKLIKGTNSAIAWLLSSQRPGY